MRKVWPSALFGCGIFFSMLGGNRETTSARGSKANSRENGAARVVLQEHRGSELDLAVAGELPGVPRGATRYISREELLKLPQVTYAVSDDPNFKGTVEVSGVLLEELSSAIGTLTAASFVGGMCRSVSRQLPAELHSRTSSGAGAENRRATAERLAEEFGSDVCVHGAVSDFAREIHTEFQDFCA